MYFSGSNLFLLAVSIRLKMIAEDWAPSKLCENNQFLRPITKVLIARSARLFDKTSWPSSKTFLKVSSWLSA